MPKGQGIIPPRLFGTISLCPPAIASDPFLLIPASGTPGIKKPALRRGRVGVGQSGNSTNQPAECTESNRIRYRDRL